MAIHTLHSEPVSTRYRASLCSGAFLFQIILFGIIVVVPYAISYATAGMWLFERCYRQQPDVLFQHQLLLTTKGSTDFSQIFWSTSENFNQMIQNQLRVASLTAYEGDTNRDGKKDFLELEVELPLAVTDSVQSLSLLLLLDYRLDEFSTVAMQSAAYFDYTASAGMNELFVEGDLLLRQRDPLPWSGRHDLYDLPVIDMTSQTADSYDIPTIMTEYLKRNESTIFEPRATFWTGNRGETQPFKLKLVVNYIHHRICYSPGFWQELKVGWVQYLAFLIPLVYFGSKFQSFVFRNRVVQTAVSVPESKKNM